MIDEIKKNLMFRFPHKSWNVELVGPDMVVVSSKDYMTKGDYSKLHTYLKKELKRYPELRKYQVPGSKLL